MSDIDVDQLKQRYEALGKEIEAIEEQLKQEQQAAPWPKYGDIYYYVDYLRSQDIGSYHCVHDGVDQTYIRPNLAFKTQEKAARFHKRCLLMAAMTARAEQLNEGWEADWTDDEELKYGVEHWKERFGTDYYTDINRFTFGIAVKDAEAASALLREFRSQLEELYHQS